jgi:hydroxylamine reductase
MPQISNPDMFCRQCEQTKDHKACTTVGVCGKSAETSAVQDTLMYLVKGVSTWAVAAREAGVAAEDLRATNIWTLSATFSTLTNVNFSEDRICEYIREGVALKESLVEMVTAKGGAAPTAEIASVDLQGLSNIDLEVFGHTVGVPALAKRMGDEDCFSLAEIGTYGAKGAAAYAAHCHQLGQLDDVIMTDLHLCQDWIR